MFLFSLIAAIIVYLPIISTANEPITVTGSTFTYTEGATCVIKQSDTTQSVISDLDGWCIYQLTPNATFTVEVTETSDNPLLPGAVWGFNCKSTNVPEEYPQSIYGIGCQR
jgi:hypothetical protein